MAYGRPRAIEFHDNVEERKQAKYRANKATMPVAKMLKEAIGQSQIATSRRLGGMVVVESAVNKWSQSCGCESTVWDPQSETRQE